MTLEKSPSCWFLLPLSPPSSVHLGLLEMPG